MRAPLFSFVDVGLRPLFGRRSKIERLIARQTHYLLSPVDIQSPRFKPQRHPSEHPLEGMFVRLRREAQRVMHSEFVEGGRIAEPPERRGKVISLSREREEFRHFIRCDERCDILLCIGGRQRPLLWPPFVDPNAEGVQHRSVGSMP